MNESNRERKTDIKFKIQLDEEQKEGKKLIRENQIVIITGKAGTGKSIISAQFALDFLFKKECDKVFVTRATIEVGNSMGFLPGGIDEKFNPYMEALQENLLKLYDGEKINKLITDNKIQAFPVQFIRGKTIDDILIVEESQNLTKPQMLAILTRLGKTGKIIINGDIHQSDIREKETGLHYVIELSKHIPEIKHIDLKNNHRSDLVGKIISYEYEKK